LGEEKVQENWINYDYFLLDIWDVYTYLAMDKEKGYL